MGHTPGPWVIQAVEPFCFDVFSELGSTWNGVRYTDDHVALYIRRKSDANLIAAAPDLLAACKAAVKNAGRYEDWLASRIGQTYDALSQYEKFNLAELGFFDLIEESKALRTQLKDAIAKAEVSSE